MSAEAKHPRTSEGATQRRLALELVGVSAAVGLLATVLGLWLSSLTQDLILRETEVQLRSWALLAAGRVDGDALLEVEDFSDFETPQFQRVQFQLTQIQSAAPQLRWVYTMRYSGEGDVWTFLVDASPHDLDVDGDGKIAESEIGTKPGDIYEAGRWHPTIFGAQKRSQVDMTPVDDPPWGITVSGWAPIRTSDGRLAGVLGIDLMYDQVLSKMNTIRIVIVGTMVLVAFLIIFVFYLLRRRTFAYSQMMELQEQLVAVRNIYAKFVPEKVRRELELHPDGSSLERVERDVTVMFADIASFTKLSERLPGESIADLLERYFSRYLEIIHAHRGQVNETAGDGLMVIFESEPPSGHAIDAVRAAIEIQRATHEINDELDDGEEPTLVNIGLNSGTAYVGLNKFRGVTGDRYTYTATGPTTNVAARVAGLSKNGDILLSQVTAERVRGEVPSERFGRRTLKNVGKPMMIYRPKGTAQTGRVDPAVSGATDAVQVVDPLVGGD